jgi:uncharacterized protein YlbG (UPF0298 family)
MTYHDPNKIFYVCSFGGCGSQIICHYLGWFGEVYHIHSRNPPEKLTTTGYAEGNNDPEWFTGNEIKEGDLKKYKVLYIYRNPVDCILSRFDGIDHLKNIQCSDVHVKKDDCVARNRDLYELGNFFDNYTSKTMKNYQVYCVKYETFWDNIQEFNQLMEIPSIPSCIPERKETDKPKDEVYYKLLQLYKPLIDKMNTMKAIEIK